MRILKNRSKASTIALILVLAMSVSLVAFPAADAQGRKATHSVCGLIPDPVGVGQEVLVWLGITDFTSYPKPGWDDLTVTVTRPDNTTETLGPFTTDMTGSTGTVYVPATAGTYYFQTHFPETVLEIDVMNVFGMLHIAAGTVMEASSSERVSLTVREEPIEYHPGSSLPTEYWTRPIDAQHREWASIAGNWLSTPPNYLAPYNDGPETAHILWTKPLATGGLVGGEYGPHAFEEGDAYQGKMGHYTGLGNPVIINGILYYNLFQQGFMSAPAPAQTIVAVDLRTGEELWVRNNTRLAFGQIVYWDSFNLHGAYAYLWEVPEVAVAIPGSTWHAYDAFTGEWVYTMENVPPGTNVYGPNGEILRYVVDQANGRLSLWNSTAAVSFEGWTVPDIIAETGMLYGQAEFAHGSWVPFGRTIDASQLGWMWNVSIPTNLPGGVTAVLEDRIIGTTLSPFYGFIPDPLVIWGISTKPGQEGTLLFNTTWRLPPGNLTLFYGAASVEDGVFTLRSKETRQHWGFNLDTGAQLWGPTASQNQVDIFDVITAIGDGKLFSTGMGGVVYCYDVKTGDLEWTYEAEDPYNEILWANNWPGRMLFITDGKVYVGHEEHSPIDPKPRGAPFICLDIETGDVVWRADNLFRQTHWGGRAIIGDSIIATWDTYDNRIYAIGKGPTAIEISAPQTVVPEGTPILIQGRVTDQSPGAKDTPAIADEFMSEWMSYLYKQFPAPMNIHGVDVILQAMSSDGTIIDIATVTSDGYGCFSYKWTPPDEDTYTIMGIFVGSKSYWSSYGQTGLGVGPAPPEYGTDAWPAYPEAPAYTTIDLAIIVAVIVVAILVVYDILFVRRRK